MKNNASGFWAVLCFLLGAYLLYSAYKSYSLYRVMNDLNAVLSDAEAGKGDYQAATYNRQYGGVEFPFAKVALLGVGGIVLVCAGGRLLSGRKGG